MPAFKRNFLEKWLILGLMADNIQDESGISSFVRKKIFFIKKKVIVTQARLKELPLAKLEFYHQNH